jgi:hypothetical protein
MSVEFEPIPARFEVPKGDGIQILGEKLLKKLDMPSTFWLKGKFI